MDIDLEQFKFRDKKKADEILRELERADEEITVMHVCGTHQDTLVKHGLEPILKDVGVDIRQGPGCPVCVTNQKEIEEIIKLAEEGITVTAFGDMINVPGLNSSLRDAKSWGAKVKIVYGVDDAVKYAEGHDEEVVFMSVGFETTTPSIASAILNEPPGNFSILTCNRIIPPALKLILETGEIGLDGLIEPGHVSAIIGTEPYEPLSERFHIPQVVAGFEPLDLLLAALLLVRQRQEGRAEVENEYDRVVKAEGNLKAKNAMEKVFKTKDVEWRGFPTIRDSGLKLRNKFNIYDARRIFEDELEEIWEKEYEEPEGCLCGEVLRGVVDSEECPKFAEECTPQNPIGPCMVSREGGCNIAFRYKRKK
ncbi:MAG: hydrogenase formation protein HypD [Candidatus Saliniplasma sp.]